jgi:hypothetical protein
MLVDAGQIKDLERIIRQGRIRNPVFYALTSQKRMKMKRFLAAEAWPSVDDLIKRLTCCIIKRNHLQRVR